MTLGAMIENLYLTYGNQKVDIEARTPSVRKKYGSYYHNDILTPYGGMYGRLGQVPAYLASCEVVSYESVKEDEHYHETVHRLII